MKLAKVMPTRKELSSAVEIKKLHQENGAQNPSCNLCNEASLFMKKDNSIGTMTPYGAVIVAKVGAKEKPHHDGNESLRVARTIVPRPFIHNPEQACALEQAHYTEEENGNSDRSAKPIESSLCFFNILLQKQFF